MFRHVVMMQFAPHATEEDVDAIVQGLRALPSLVPVIRRYSVGLDAGLVDGNFDLVVVADFDDVDGYLAYNANADHQAVLAERIKPFVAGRSAVQYLTE
jgi:hypothetical protein